MNYKQAYKPLQTRYNKTTQRIQSSELLFENLVLNKKEDENCKWLKSCEAATYLRISPNALRILVHRAKVKSYKLGNRLRFKQSDLFLALQPKED